MSVYLLIGLSPVALLSLEGPLSATLLFCLLGYWLAPSGSWRRTGFGPDPRNLRKQPCNKTWSAMCVCLILTNMWTEQSRGANLSEPVFSTSREDLGVGSVWSCFLLSLFWMTLTKLRDSKMNEGTFSKCQVHITCILCPEFTKSSFSVPPTSALSSVRWAQQEPLMHTKGNVKKCFTWEGCLRVIVYEIQMRYHAWIK